jgi:hypothetical protein
MLYLFPLVHYPSIDYSSKRKFEIIAIPDILNSFPMFIYNGVNLQELNSQIAVLKPLILPKSNSFSISYPPSKIHASCLCSPFTPLPKGGDFICLQHKIYLETKFGICCLLYPSRVRHLHHGTSRSMMPIDRGLGPLDQGYLNTHTPSKPRNSNWTGDTCVCPQGHPRRSWSYEN